MNEKQFLAGAAKVDVTPPLGTFINGDFVPHYAQYIHDPLHARALVFRQGDVLTAFVVVDICVMPYNMVKDIKAEVQKQTGIAPDNVLISATHTHAGGSVAQVYLGAADMQYMVKLPPLVVQAVVEAKKNLRPAKIAWGGVDVPEHVLTRRYAMKPGYDVSNPVFGTKDKLKTNPFLGERLIDHGVGAVDPEVGFLAVKGLDDKWIGVLANYSLHYVGDWGNGVITADYFAVFAENLKKRLGAGDDFVGIMSNGTSGNINIWEFLNPERYPSGEFEKSKMIGEDIAGRVAAQLESVNWDSEPALAAQYQDINVQLRKPSAKEVEEAKEIVIKTNYENLEITHIKGLKELYAREQIMLADLPDTMYFAIQAIKVGNGVIGAMGAEMFAETGLWLKEQSPVDNYFTICLANGNAGYVPPQHEFENGGYETWRGRTSQLVENTEGIVREELLGLVKSLYR